MRKNYMKPAASCYGFAINENIATSLPRVEWQGIPAGATVGAEMVDGVVKAVMVLPDGSKVYGTSWSELAAGVMAYTGDDFEAFVTIMTQYGLQAAWLD